MLQLALVTFFSALITAIATGIGGVPFLFTKRLPDRLVGLAWVSAIEGPIRDA